ncbi:hypothetical protein Q9K01_01665 [Qipengyuania sp. DY56-A-20]|uniref:Uncharacterized protein n=1 Tax=Qipengyuania benthica TaxID=3067651 RepID=A0ABT9H4U4_9SPHN|nr:hypothetical protein [Qipengyuania sp. DY56-A-20]MDP4538335.1 hypothetical protein [Qipengyuania sp. DY56-A-20]
MAQAVVTAADPTVLDDCCRLTALYMVMPIVSAIATSSIAEDCEGAWPTLSVTTFATDSTI